MVENVLRVESECEIIKPTFIKRKYYKIFMPNQISEIRYDENLFNDIQMKKNENPKYFDDINIMNKQSKEGNKYFHKSQKDKKDYFTLEILTILNQPINNIHCMNRNKLENDKSEIYNYDENNNIDFLPINKLEGKKEYDLDYSF
jgi:hypothetical protein